MEMSSCKQSARRINRALVLLIPYQVRPGDDGTAAIRRSIQTRLAAIAAAPPPRPRPRRFADVTRDALDALSAKSMIRPPGTKASRTSAAQAAEAGFVRFAPGAILSRHKHLGVEKTFVLDGVMPDRGNVYGPGSVIESTAGTGRDYTAGPGRALIIVSLHNGFEFC